MVEAVAVDGFQSSLAVADPETDAESRSAESVVDGADQSSVLDVVTDADQGETDGDGACPFHCVDEAVGEADSDSAGAEGMDQSVVDAA